MVVFAQHSSIYILYSPLYKSSLSWTIFNSDNVHVLGMYNDGFSSYSCWLSSKFFRIVFLSKKGSLLKIYQMPIATNSFFVAKNLWTQQFYFIATCYCHNSILYRYILLLQKMADTIVVNNIKQYIVAASFFAGNYLLVAKIIVAPIYVFVAI